MKTIFSLTLVLLLGVKSFKSYSQANLSDIYQAGSIWSELHTLEMGMGVKYQTNYLIKIGSDTTINSVLYKKLNMIRKPVGNGNIVDYGTIGGIRVNARQVYFIRTKALPNTINGDTEYQSFTVNSFPLLSEITLYDFNLIQGTTLPWKQNNPSVISVGSVTLNNNQTISTYTFWSQSPYQETWKDGLGSEQGFFGSYRSFNYTNRFEPTCFTSPSLTFPNNCSIPLISGIKEFSSEGFLNIYPNPVISTELNIAATNNLKVNRIEIYNVLGEQIFRKNYGTTPTQITLNLNSGVYLIKFISENGKITTSKIVKN